MPIISNADHDNHLLHTVCSGVITPSEVKDYLQTTWLDPNIYSYNELFDFSESDCSLISHGDLITIAQNAAKLYMIDANARFAFLTFTPQHQHISNFYITAKSLMPGPTRKIQSFDNRQQAMRWLS